MRDRIRLLRIAKGRAKSTCASILAVSSIAAILLLAINVAAGPYCPMPDAGETEKKIPNEDQTEIPQGTCRWVTLKGKMRYENASLSLDQTNGSGFHFGQDNGPTSVETTENRVLICSASTSCGSASIVIDVDGNAKTMGSVRSSYGFWYFKAYECFLSGQRTSTTMFRIERGAHRQDQGYRETAMTSGIPDECKYFCEENYLNCAGRCNTSYKCDPTYGCVECVTFETYPSYEWDFPCADEHVPYNGGCSSTVRCYCTIANSLKHYIFKCPQ